MRKNNLYIIILFCFLVYGCFDIFKSEEVDLVGNIALINPHDGGVDSYRMVYLEDGYNTNIITEKIVKVIGNDSILLVKSNPFEENYKYYKLFHKKGQNPLKIDTIDLSNFNLFAKMINHKYKFESN